MDISSAGAGFALGATVVGFLAKFVFITKGELTSSEQRQADALLKHEKEDRDRNEAAFTRIYDKMEKIDGAISDLRVELATKYSRNRRANDTKEDV